MPARNAKQLARRVRAAIFDVDGVMTDGRLYFDAAGEALKVFNVRDGYGLVALRRAGIAVGVITGRGSPPLDRRLAELGIEHVAKRAADKAAALDAMLEAMKVEPGHACYTGDDIPDLPAMQRVGLPIAVADAAPAILEAALLVTDRRGGDGAVREVCDYLLEAGAGRGNPA